MEMLVRILGVGSEWWVRPGPVQADPLRFTKHAAYFNTTAFPHGNKFRRSWKVPGVLRFNGNSRIDPHRPKDVIGCVFGCIGVTNHQGQNRLLAVGKRYGPLTPTHYLVAIDSRLHGYIDCSSSWKNEGVNTVAFSEYDGLQQALVLLSEAGQFVTGAGVWHISKQSGMERLQLITDREHWA
jgi:hypothetical protein